MWVRCIDSSAIVDEAIGQRQEVVYPLPLLDDSSMELESG